MAGDELLYEVRGAVAWLTLNRPQSGNALTARLVGLLDEALDRIAADGTVRVACLTGAGDRIFCSGADLRAAAGEGEGGFGPVAYARLLRRMLRFDRPLVARVNGHCMGGGVGLLLACDLAYAREDVRIGTPEAKVGLFPMMVAPLLMRSVPRKRAMEMVLTGQPVPAPEAAAAGLVTRAIPADAFDAGVEAVLAAVAANAPLALRWGREAIDDLDGGATGEAIERLSSRLSDLLATDDAAEGLAAFLAKRPPDWKGR